MLLAISGIVIFLGIQTAEMNYTGSYSTKSNYISDLGVNSTAGLIFNLSMMIAGLLVIIASHQLTQSKFSLFFTIPLLIYGVGTFGVGLFPSSIGFAHGFGALLLFVTGPIVAIKSRKYTNKGFSRVSLTLGILSALFLLNMVIAADAENIGGIERWAVYPITMWLIVFGAHLAATGNPHFKLGKNKNE